ncbi:nuclear distribution protein PAC1-1 [Flagelloscypha sp. PMI_526]|nr:nuclear distribution protein PAC1-1 [Flagelloscypha sp. PMI_526]
MGILSERHQNELDRAILQYLESRNLKQTAASFREEVNFDGSSDPRPDGILEKKWVAVIRLQKKILELETRNSALEEEARSNPVSRAAGAVGDWLPKPGGHFALTGHRASVTRVSFHPTQPLLASASEDFTIKIWDWESGDLQRTLSGHTREVKDVDFHPRGEYLVSAASDLTVRLWSTEEWDKPGYNGAPIYGHDHTISCARFTPSGDHIVSASRDRTIKIWEVTTKFCIKTITGHSDWVRYVVPSTDGRFLASCSNDHTSRIVDFKSGQLKTELRGHDNTVEVVEFVPVNAYQYIRQWTGDNDTSTEPGAYLVTGARDKFVILWEGQGGRQLKKFSHDGWIQGIVFHPSGKFMLTVSDDKQLRVWDLTSGRCTRTIEAHDRFIYCIAWTNMMVPSKGEGGKDAGMKRANVIATAGVDRTVKIWMP